MTQTVKKYIPDLWSVLCEFVFPTDYITMQLISPCSICRSRTRVCRYVLHQHVQELRVLK